MENDCVLINEKISIFVMDFYVTGRLSDYFLDDIWLIL
jgi:hypothetical protein